MRRTMLPPDPFEGRGARRTHRRLRVEGLIALALAIAACGLTAAAWAPIVTPFVERLALASP